MNDWKRKADYQCPYAKKGCTKKFKTEGMNDENFNRHVESCKYGVMEKHGIASYFKKRSQSASREVNITPTASASNINEDEIEVISVVEAVDSGDSQNNNTLVRCQNNDTLALVDSENNDTLFDSEHDDTLVDIEHDTLERVEKSSSKENTCKGYEITFEKGSVLSHYPFHRHDTEGQDSSTLVPFSIKLSHDHNGTLLVAHAKGCDRLIPPADDRNKACKDIHFSSTMKKLIEIGDSDEPNVNMKLDMLSFQQLKDRYRELKAKTQKERLDTLNLVRKNRNLTKQVTLNNRFREAVTGTDIPRLGSLLHVCHRKGMGLQSIIGRIGDAITMRYRCRKYGEDIWDISTLVLRIGGPKLLYILHKTHGLPHPRSARRHNETENDFAASVDISFEDRINKNKSVASQSNTIKTIKMDEIATETRLRWNNKDNKILGLCYQHSHKVDMSLDTIEDALLIRDEIESGSIHKTKETLVVASGEVGNGGYVKSILALPSCKAETDQLLEMVDAVSKVIDPNVIATDGDGQRRKAFNGRNKIIQDNDVKGMLTKLPLFDLNIVDGKCALFFDDKHNSKRLRGVVISDTRGCLIGNNVISADQLKYLFDEVGITNYKSVLYPNDRQNVPAVLRLVELLNECVSKIQDSTNQVCCELLDSIHILITVFDGILCVFSSLTINLSDQLRKLSTLSHVLFYQYKLYGTAFIPGQLYHDLQRMVQASYYVCALQKSRGGGKVFLYQIGTDQLEKVFGSVRTITHARNCDTLELTQRLQHAETINKIISKHPTWKRFHGKRLGSYHDASSQVDWSGNLESNDVDLHKQWNLGKADACRVQHIDPSCYSPPPGCSMLKPKKRLVGVTIDTEREEVDDDDDDQMSDQTQDSENSENPSDEVQDNFVALDVEEFIEDNETNIQIQTTIDVNGKVKHKASVVRELFNETGSSTDRLRRVRSYTKFLSTDESDIVDESDDIDLDNMIMLGDKVCAKVALSKGSACFVVGKISSIRSISNRKFQTVASVDKVGDLQFQVNICHGTVKDGNLEVGDASQGLHTWKGAQCVSLNLCDSAFEFEKVCSLMTSLPVAECQPIQFSWLPYHPSLEVELERGETESKRVCKICGEEINAKSMRKHVGKHVLSENLDMVCGFCGLKSCSIELVRGSGRGKTATLIPGSNCEYITKFSLKSAEKTTKSGPCTNRPIVCEQCNTVQWSYNMPSHYKLKHTDFPPPVTVSVKEKQFLGIL